MAEKASRARSWGRTPAAPVLFVLRKMVSAVRRARLMIEAALATLVALGYYILLIAWIRRQPRRESPRIWWGAAPLINNKWHSRAVRARGYESYTVVTTLYHITARSDFDFVASELVDATRVLRRLPVRMRRRLEPFLLFAWSLPRFDIFVYYASSRVLRDTKLRWWELRMLHMARKKIVLIPFGADVQLNSRMRGLLLKHAYTQDYPAFVRAEERVRGELYHCSRHADYILTGCDWVDHMPWWDGLTSGHFSIDTEEWAPAAQASRGGADGPVTVLHAPNHRTIKGTSFLLAAVAELQAEGVPIELRILERVPNTEVRRAMEEADIVADQFIIGWYALFAVEAMAMGKPVLCYMRPDLLELYSLYSYAAECPVVDTHPARIKEVLRELVADPERRAELGRRGREYVERHHSLEAAGELFDGIFQRVWAVPGS